ncbi:MAG TPA: hypothetical protein VH968_09965 [Gaiellaceae bacterium]
MGLPGLVDRVITVGIALAVAAAAWIFVSQFAYVFVFDGDAGPLNADAENNAFSWAGSVVTFTGAFVAFLLANVLQEQRGRFLVLAGTLALFSLDDTLQLHEDGGTRVANELGLGDSWVHGLWPALFFPLLVFAFLLLWRVAEGLSERAGLVLRVGLGLLVLGVAAEALASLWYSAGETAETFVGALQIAIEEGAELAGWVLIVAGLTAAACRAIGDLAATRA